TRPGGIGKTWLALETGAGLIANKAGCVSASKRAVFVALAEVNDATRVCDAILRSLGGRPIDGIDSLEQVSEALVGEQSTLLILDNFEHLSETSGLLVGDLLARVPR